MKTEREFLDSIGNPKTEDEAQVAVGVWLAEQIGHRPASITYRCLGHYKGVSYCAYADGPNLLGMTFADIYHGNAFIAPSEKHVSNEERIRKLIEVMSVYAGCDEFEMAAMCRDLVEMLGVDPLTYKPR